MRRTTDDTMSRTNTGQPVDQEPDERVERLVDASLQAMMQPRTPDLSLRVMQALDGVDMAQARPAGGRVVQVPWRRVAWRPAVAAAAAVAVACVAVFLAWPAEDTRERRTAAPLASAPALAAHRLDAPLVERPKPALAPATKTFGRRLARASSPAAATINAEARSWQADEASLASTEPHLPGAPAGDLGDPLQPMPGPPAIAIPPIAHTPIQTAPPVSEGSRPVTDFPADHSPRDVRGTSDSNGGTRR